MSLVDHCLCVCELMLWNIVCEHQLCSVCASVQSGNLLFARSHGPRPSRGRLIKLISCSAEVECGPFSTEMAQRQFWVQCGGKFAVKWILKIPPHFAHVATLPCETLMSAKPALHDNYKVIAAYLRCGGVVNNQNKKGLLLSLRVKIFF